MLEVIGLLSKLYASKVVSSDEMSLKRKLEDFGYDENDIDEIISNSGLTKKVEHVKKSVLKTQITFEEYVI